MRNVSRADAEDVHALNWRDVIVGRFEKKKNFIENPGHGNGSDQSNLFWDCERDRKGNNKL